jgi:hypothetical protein
VVVAVADDGLPVRGDVPPTDVSANAWFAYIVHGLGRCAGGTGCHAGDSSGKGECGQNSCDAFHAQEYAPSSAAAKYFSIDGSAAKQSKNETAVAA